MNGLQQTLRGRPNMKLRNIISATLLITSLVATSGCDSALTHEEGAEDMGTAQKALTHETRQCVSASTAVSDAWCESVGCSETSIASGDCMYLGEGGDATVCTSSLECDTRREDATDAHRGETYAAARTGTSSASQGPVTTWNPVSDSDEKTSYDFTGDDVDNTVRHNDDLVETEESSSTDELDSTLLEVDEDAGDVEVPNSLVFEETSTEDELDEEELEEEVSIYGDSATCPEGWEYQEIDCTYLPADHGLAAHCDHQLLPSTTELCGDQDRDSLVCLVPDHDTTSTFGMGDGAGMAQQRCVNIEEAF